MKVFWTSIEYSYLDDKSLKGGFVYAFVKAFDVKEALAKLLAVFTKKKMIPNEIEYIMPYDSSTEWETSEETSKFLKLYNKASKIDDVVFDTFYAYENH